MGGVGGGGEDAGSAEGGGGEGGKEGRVGGEARDSFGEGGDILRGVEEAGAGRNDFGKSADFGDHWDAAAGHTLDGGESEPLGAGWHQEDVNAVVNGREGALGLAAEELDAVGDAGLTGLGFHQGALRAVAGHDQAEARILFGGDGEGGNHEVHPLDMFQAADHADRDGRGGVEREAGLIEEGDMGGDIVVDGEVVAELAVEDG